MSFKTFAELGGFKLLAVARLSSGAYSLVCYLLNCMAAGIEEVLSSAGELSVLLGVSEKAVKQALDELTQSKIVTVTPGSSGNTLVIKMTLDPRQWENLRRSADKRRRTPLGDAHNVRPLHSQEALMFPSTRGATGLQTPPQLMALDGGKGLDSSHGAHHKDPVTVDVQRVLDAYKETHAGTTFDPDKERAYAQLLVETHPAEHVLSLIRHYKGEIPSLGLLAGAWMHFFEKYNHALHHNETPDFEAYRKKFESAERRLRSLANAEIKRAQANKRLLTPDEELLLRLFMRHDQPRRQLYWALQARERYPHLQDFFDITAEIASPPPLDHHHHHHLGGHLHPKRP